MSIKKEILKNKYLVNLDFASIKNPDSLKDHCLMCRESLTNDTFSLEHIFPKWLLRKYDLFGKGFSLINGTKTMYRNLTIPCCKECNGKYMSEYETKIKDAFERGFDYVKLLPENVLAWWLYKIYYGIIAKEATLKNDIKSKSSKTMIDEFSLEKFDKLYVYMSYLMKGFVFNDVKPYSLHCFKSSYDGFDCLFSPQNILLINVSNTLIIADLDGHGIVDKMMASKLEEAKQLMELSILQGVELFAYFSYYRELINFNTSISLCLSGSQMNVNVEILDLKQQKEDSFEAIKNRLLEAFSLYNVDLTNVTDSSLPSFFKANIK